MIGDAAHIALIIRFVHVISAGILIGGSTLVWVVAWKFPKKDATSLRSFITTAEQYEWIFWSTLGLLVMTGVGNLGSFGTHVPEHATRWGNTLSLKFIGAIFLLSISLVRTLLISQVMAAKNRQLTPTGVGILRQFYAGTTILITLLILLALSLAHGS